jgi:flagellin
MIEQAKGIAQAAQSAGTDVSSDTQTITVSGTMAVGDHIDFTGMAGVTLSAGPSAVATSTSYTNFTLTFAANADNNDTVKVGGATFTASNGAGTTTVYDSFAIDVTTAAAGESIKVGGVTFTATAQTSTTVQNSIGIDLSADTLAGGDTISVGGVTYTATAGSTNPVGTYTNFMADLTGAVAGDKITVGGVEYTGFDGAGSATQFDTTSGVAATMATSLAAKITALQGTAYGAASGGTATVTITAAGSTVLNSTSVTEVGNITLTDTHTHAVMPLGDREFLVSGSAIQDATNLQAAINANQGTGGGDVYAVSRTTNTLTITKGANGPALTAGTVAQTGAHATIDTSDTTTTANALRAGEFNISGSATADANSLRDAIMALVPAYSVTVTGAGSDQVTIAKGTASSFDVTSVQAGNGAVTFTPTTHTDANELGANEFLIGADANATAANLAAKLTAFYGSGAGAGLTTSYTGGTNVVTITGGTQDLTETTVEAGSDADHDITIAASTTVTTSAGALVDGEFAFSSNNIVNAINIATAFNTSTETAGLVTAGYSMSADNGVVTLSKTVAGVAADVAAGFATVTGTSLAAQNVNGSLATTELASLQGQFNEMLVQMTAVANDSGYKGKNLLAANNVIVQFEGNQLTVAGFDASAVSGLGITQATWTAGGNIDADLSNLDDALSGLRQKSSTLAGNLSIITVRQDFSTNMINTLTQGSDKLTLADANEEGANMLMLQTRQSLSTTALSLSAQAAQSVLKLFG